MAGINPMPGTSRAVSQSHADTRVGSAMQRKLEVQENKVGQSDIHPHS